MAVRAVDTWFDLAKHPQTVALIGFTFDISRIEQCGLQYSIDLAIPSIVPMRY